MRPSRRFYFRLALYLGMTVKELLNNIDSYELTEWMAFFNMEPWGTAVEDIRMGTIASLIANSNRDPKKHPKAFTAADFIPKWKAPKPQEQDPEEQERVLNLWKAVTGGDNNAHSR